MSKHDADHDGAKRKKIHHDWRFWTAIVLMGLGIGAYVITLDDSSQTGAVDQSEVPVAEEKKRANEFVGRWTMDSEMYVEALREQQEKIAPGVLENYTKLFGSEEAAHERLEKLQEGQLDRARQRSLHFDLGADGSFTGRLSGSPRGPTDYQGQWIVWPHGAILFDTEVLQPGLKEPSPALGWILAIESDSHATMRLYAGRLGLMGRAGLEFARADAAAAGKTDVPVASPGADPGFVGTWRYDTKTVVEHFEAIQQRIGGEGNAVNNSIAKMAGSQLDLTLKADGSYVLQAQLLEIDGKQKHATQSGAWYRAGDVVVCIGGDLEFSIGSEIPHRNAFVLRRTSDGFEQVAGLMSLLNTQPPVPFDPVD